MTSATTAVSLTPDLVVDDSVVASAVQDQRDAERAEARAHLVRSGERLEKIGWASLVFAIVVTLGDFGSIAWHDSVASRGGAPVATSAP
jgi:hypothetical protein